MWRVQAQGQQWEAIKDSIVQSNTRCSKDKCCDVGLSIAGCDTLAWIDLLPVVAHVITSCKATGFWIGKLGLDPCSFDSQKRMIHRVPLPASYGLMLLFFIFTPCSHLHWSGCPYPCQLYALDLWIALEKAGSKSIPDIVVTSRYTSFHFISNAKVQSLYKWMTPCPMFSPG